jgi:hypothetical protein
VLLHTTDGGASWQPATDDGTVRDLVESPPAWTGVGSMSYRLAADGSAVQISSDGGATFTRYPF